MKGFNNSDIVLVFDGNGFIAGVQNVVPVLITDESKYPFSTSPWYNKGDFFGQEVYYNSAYFVDPSIICNGGRTQEDFDRQGTGDRMVLQNGPTPDSVYDIPLVQGGMTGNVCVAKRFLKNIKSKILDWL